MGLNRVLTEHELWPKLRPFVILDKAADTKNSRYRFWVANAEPKLMTQFQAMTVACAGCGRRIHPVRFSRGRHYISVSCPLDVNIGCSRQKVTSDECKRIVAAVKNGER